MKKENSHSFYEAPRIQCLTRIIYCITLAFTLLNNVANAQDMTNRPTGLLFVDPATYQSIPLATTPLMGELPSSADLSKHFPKPGNQGKQGSCVGWAIAYGLKSYQEGMERHWDLTEKEHIFSPAFIYNQIKVSPDCNGGTSYIEALNLLRRDGVAPLAAFPYNDTSCSAKPDSKTKQVARQFVIADWRRVNVQDETEVKNHLAAGFPVLIGMIVDRSFINLKGESPYSQFTGENLGGHAMVLIGYNDDKEAFRVLNSWGQDWGDKGYAWINYRAFRAVTREGYVAQDVIVTRPDDHTPPQPIVTNAPPVLATNPVVTIGMPTIQYNMPITTDRGVFPGIVVRVPGAVKGGSGKDLQVILRFAFPNGTMLFANAGEALYRDATGWVASGTRVIPIATDNFSLDGITVSIPYYALNLSPSNGFNTYYLSLTAFVYLDNFQVNQSLPIPFMVRY